MQPRLVALFVLAFVLYAVASVGAAGAGLDFGVLALALVAGASALTPLWVQRPELAPGAALVATLGSAQALGLAAVLSRAAHAFLGEVLCALAAPLVGVSVLRLALHVPDAPRRLARRPRWVWAMMAIAGTGALLGMLAALPPVHAAGRWLIAPARWSLAPVAAAGLCFALAMALRGLRARLGSEPRALAANSWAGFGLAGASCALVIALWLAQRGDSRAALHTALASAGALLWLGHAWAVTPRRVRVASRWLRELLATGAALAIALAVAASLARWWPQANGHSVALALAFALVLLAVRRTMRRLVQRLFAPHAGLLLAAIEEARGAAPGAVDVTAFAEQVLRPLRRAGSLPETAPRLVTIDPPRVVQLDAAGAARSSATALPTAIGTRFSGAAQGSEPLVRSELAARLSRRPDLAPVVKALDELDALCVQPLIARGELEALLVIARGARRDPLTFEELLQLERLAAQLAPTLSGLLALERAHQRADRAQASSAALAVRVEEQEGELAAARSHTAALKAGLGLPLPARDPVQYSPAMRALTAQLERAAPHDVPLLLWGETGLALAPVAQWIHRVSGRAHEPFVMLDGGALEADGAPRLFGAGGAGNPRPGLLELIGAGTLLVTDLCALSSEVQLALAAALEERAARPVDSGASYPVRARVIATARRPLPELVEAGALAPELARWFEATSYRVPPLRERPEDLESLLLLALDRAARVLGRPAKGVDADALKALVEYEWPGNEGELVSVIERALARAKHARIRFADLPALAAGASALSAGSFADQERDILRRALTRAGGDHTRAARALGLKRAAFVEKLRRLDVKNPTSAEN